MHLYIYLLFWKFHLKEEWKLGRSEKIYCERNKKEEEENTC